MHLDPAAVVIREDFIPTDLWHVWYRFIGEHSYTSRLATFYAEAPALIYADRLNSEQMVR